MKAAASRKARYATSDRSGSDHMTILLARVRKAAIFATDRSVWTAVTVTSLYISVYVCALSELEESVADWAVPVELELELLLPAVDPAAVVAEGASNIWTSSKVR